MQVIHKLREKESINANSENDLTQYKLETLRQKLHTHNMRKNILNQTFLKGVFAQSCIFYKSSILTESNQSTDLKLYL